MFQAIKRTIGPKFIWAGVLKILHDIVMFLNPFILEQLLNKLSAPGELDKSHTFGLAVAMLAAAVLETLTVNIYFHMLYHISLHLKVGTLIRLYACLVHSA